MEYTRGDRRARLGGRQARQGHNEPCQSTVHHASTYAQGHADMSRTSRAHAGAEQRTRRATQGHHGHASRGRAAQVRDTPRRAGPSRHGRQTGPRHGRASCAGRAPRRAGRGRAATARSRTAAPASQRSRTARYHAPRVGRGAARGRRGEGAPRLRAGEPGPRQAATARTGTGSGMPGKGGTTPGRRAVAAPPGRGGRRAGSGRARASRNGRRARGRGKGHGRAEQEEDGGRGREREGRSGLQQARAQVGGGSGRRGEMEQGRREIGVWGGGS
jgi:hypothetical protein